MVQQSSGYIARATARYLRVEATHRMQQTFKLYTHHKQTCMLCHDGPASGSEPFVLSLQHKHDITRLC